MAGSRRDRPGAGDVLDPVDESQEFHRRNHAELRADLEKLRKAVAGAVQVDDFLGRAGDDVRTSQLDRLRHPPPAVVKHSLVLGPVRRDPTMKCDHADHLEARVGDRPSSSSAKLPPCSR